MMVTVYTIQNSICINNAQRLILCIKTIGFSIGRVLVDMLICVIIAQILLFCISSGYFILFAVLSTLLCIRPDIIFNIY